MTDDRPSEGSPRHRPNQDEDASVIGVRAADSAMPRESRESQPDIANDDKKARSGTEAEPVRNTPPFGDWDDTASR
jgi:hypothetical protein